jgi:hypothetical protein
MEDECADETPETDKLRKLANLTAPFVGIEVGHLHFDEFEIRQKFCSAH